jgi:23S rRNA (cytosine1962-C5)-methyltransferase
MRDFTAVLQECARRFPEETHPRTVRRLFHGRGHCYPGFEDLTVDLLGGYVLVACFGDDEAGATALACRLAAALPGTEGACVQVRQGRSTRGRIAAGEVPERVWVSEGGLEYLVRPLRNQNIGLFLDMAPTRAWVRERAEGASVLNLFAYTCAFSVAAVAGGARQVVNNDMSRPALDWGTENHRQNAHDLRRVRMLPHNVFKSWWKIRQLGPYDLVIIDPPTNQRGSFVAEKDYPAVLKRLPDLCAPGAEVIACLNSPFLNADHLPQLMARWCPECRFEELLPASPDFPDRFPDRGLKVCRFRFPG